MSGQWDTQAGVQGFSEPRLTVFRLSLDGRSANERPKPCFGAKFCLRLPLSGRALWVCSVESLQR